MKNKKKWTCHKCGKGMDNPRFSMKYPLCNVCVKPYEEILKIDSLGKGE